jgi:hypothetical protein
MAILEPGPPSTGTKIGHPPPGDIQKYHGNTYALIKYGVREKLKKS